MTIRDFIEKTGAEVVNVEDENRQICGCHICDLLSLVMSKAKENDVWLTVQTNVNVAAVCVLAEISCAVLTEGMQPDEDLAKKAKEQGVNILKTDKNAYEIAKILSESGI